MLWMWRERSYEKNVPKSTFTKADSTTARLTGKRLSTRSSVGRGRVAQERPSTSNMNNRKWKEKIRSGSQSLGDEMYDNSFYVTGKVHGVVINFLVDTGATTTLMSEETFRKISENTPIM